MKDQRKIIWKRGKCLLQGSCVLDGIVWILGHQAHGYEAAHGGVGLGLLLVVHRHVGHVVLPVHGHLVANDQMIIIYKLLQKLPVNRSSKRFNVM